MQRSKTTSSIDILRQILGKLNGAIPPNESGENLFQCWTKVLGGKGRSQHDVLETILDISKLFEKAAVQLDASEHDDDTKKAAYSLISQAGVLTKFESLYASAHSFKQRVSPQVTGGLGLIAGALRAEFPMAVISPSDREGIRTRLDEMLALLDTENFPQDLRLLAKKNISDIIWWLDNNQLIDPQDLLTKSAAVAVVAQQLEAAQPEGSKAGSGIKERAKSIINTVWKATKFAVENEETLEKIESFATDLIS